MVTQNCRGAMRSRPLFPPLGKILTRSSYYLALVLCLGVVPSFTSYVQAESPQGLGTVGDKDYKPAGVRSGVWNDGQAALWDLNFLDHFHIFGPVERARGYKPEQPIKFSHITHVQRNKMECQFCHWTVSKSSYAAIPEVETCWGCHKHVKGSDDAQKAEIAKLSEYVEATTEFDANTGGFKNNFKKPIPWVKVHVMPDHVRFNHKRHVKAGVACSSCHGQVPEMDVVERVSSMKMGWCVSCHRAQGTSIDCNVCHY